MQRRGTSNAVGFSLVEVMLAVVILGITGLAFLDGLQSNVLQTRRVDANAAIAVVLASAVENIKAAPYVSCATTSTPYQSLPAGLVLPSGISLAVREFLPSASTPWQDCQTVRNSGIAGAAQYLLLSATDGSTRSLMRFAPGSTTQADVINPTPISAATATDATDSKSSCSKFGGSAVNKLCQITITNTGGSGTNWHIAAISFIDGVDLLYPSTTPVPQNTPITFATYIQSGSNLCPDNQVRTMSITVVDDGNGSTTIARADLKC